MSQFLEGQNMGYNVYGWLDVMVPQIQSWAKDVDIAMSSLKANPSDPANVTKLQVAFNAYQMGMGTISSTLANYYATLKELIANIR